MTTVGDRYRLSDAAAAQLLRDAPWRRLAIMGDSVAEGIGDPVSGYPDGGWADGLARILRLVHADLAYVNLGRRDLLAAQIRSTQLEPTLAFEPDLTAIAAGGNDLFRRRFDTDAVEAELDSMIGAVRAQGGDVLTFGLMDITASGLVAADYAPVLHERLVELADLTGRVAQRHGAIHLRLTEHPVAADPSVISADLIHANARGHAAITAEVVRTLAARSR